jgi:hypothetical protein
MIIKKIFKSDLDEEVHSDLLKFGRGEFKDKYLIEAKKQKNLWAIKTSSEFANFLVKNCLKDAEEEILIKGIIISTFNLDEPGFEIKKTSNFMGIKKMEINTMIKPEKILNLIEKFPRIFFALSFKTNKNELKIKPKAPKSAKPSTKGEKKLKADFCSLKTSDLNIIRKLFFDIEDFENAKEIKIKHLIKISEIEYPKEEKDPKIIREKSKRRGILIREIDNDRKRETRKAEFYA